MGFFALVWRMLEGVRKVLHLILLLIIFGFVLAALHTSIPSVPRSAALVIAPEGELVEQLSSDPLRRALGQASGGPAPETLLRDVVDAIESAKSDSRIKLIVLDLGNLSSSGLSKLQEIGAALRDFRTAGKRVVAVGDSLDQSQYYLAAQAGEVYLDPLGLVYIDGFSYYRMFLKDAIDKLGVDVNVFRAGTFKSYTDQFSRSDMAPSEREESGVWLNSLWSSYTQDVTHARSLKPSALDDYVNEAPAALSAVNGDAAKLALQRGLVTALKSRRQLADELKGLVGEDSDTPLVLFDRHEPISYGRAREARAQGKVRREGRHRRCRRRDTRRPSAAGQNRRRQHGGPAAPGTLRQRGEGRGAARG